MNDAIMRPALYYPYIHIRSEHWLKATLLCVPAVKRMVPDTYTPEDEPNIVAYTRIKGLGGGTLLQSVSAYSPAADLAQQSLLVKLEAHKSEIRSKYKHFPTAGRDAYWIHDAKFNERLLVHLVAEELVCQGVDPDARGHRNWYAIHPLLGSAIMTTLGLSIASDDHSDIVTPSAKFHEALLTTEVDRIFDLVLAGAKTKSKHESKQTASQASHDLGQLVITLSGVNFEALRPQAIPELQSSPNFGKFQNRLRTRAKSFELNGDPRDFKTQLTLEAEEIVGAWQDSKHDIGKELKNALFETSMVLTGAALKAMMKGLDMTDLAIEGGVAVALLTRKSLQLSKKRKRGGPTQYLSEVVEAQNEVLQMTFPLGLER